MAGHRVVVPRTWVRFPVVAPKETFLFFGDFFAIFFVFDPKTIKNYNETRQANYF
jgi:hypothetical protein